MSDNNPWKSFGGDDGELPCEGDDIEIAVAVYFGERIGWEISRVDCYSMCDGWGNGMFWRKTLPPPSPQKDWMEVKGATIVFKPGNRFEYSNNYERFVGIPAGVRFKVGFLSSDGKRVWLYAPDQKMSFYADAEWQVDFRHPKPPEPTPVPSIFHLTVGGRLTLCGIPAKPGHIIHQLYYFPANYYAHHTQWSDAPNSRWCKNCERVIKSKLAGDEDCLGEDGE